MTTALSDQAAAFLDQAIQCGEHTWRHIHAEYQDDNVPGIVGTLATQGPYAMTYSPELDADGLPFQRVVTTYQGIADFYAHKKSLTRTLIFNAYNEHKGSWFTFEHGVVDVLDKSTGVVVSSDLIVLFPIFDRDGITGEMSAIRDMVLFGGRPANREADGPPRRLANLQLHNRLLEALCSNKPEEVVATMADHVQTEVRDYAAAEVTVTELHGVEEAKLHYEQMFDQFHVVDVELVTRITEDWYVFAELRWQVEIDGKRATFSTAEYVTITEDGRIEMRLGHGTDPQFSE